MAGAHDFELTRVHPLVLYGRRRGWNYDKTRRFFGVPESSFKKIVRAFTGASWDRCTEWEKRSNGEVQAADCMRWMSENRRGDAA